MPALSPTMTAGNIGTWQKKVGDAIAPGDVLVEIETDKAQMDFEFQEDGVLAKILKQSGEKDIAVGNVSNLQLSFIHPFVDHIDIFCPTNQVYRYFCHILTSQVFR